MYEFTLAFHNFLRWIVLLTGLWALVRAYSGWLGNRPWSSGDHRARLFYTISLDVQFLIGIILYAVLSPITKAAFNDFGGAMKNQDLRYFAVEHLVLMILALVFAHLGAVLSRKVQDPIGRHKRLAIWFTLSMISILGGMPWFRPLFRALQ